MAESSFDQSREHGASFDSANKALKEALLELSSLTSLLDRLSSRVMVLAITCLVGAIFSSIGRYFTYSLHFNTSLFFYPGLVLLPGFMGLILIARFERARRHGDLIFEELSNEIQWGLVRQQPSDERRSTRSAKGGKIFSAGPSNPPSSKPGIDMRLVLRRFVSASDLPLAPGKNGVSFYALYFITLMFIAAVLSATPL